MTPSDDALDPLAILQALGVTDVDAVERAHGGSDTAIWRIESVGKAYALRVFHEGEERDCERERLVMQGARAAGLLVPETHAVGHWRGRPALLLSWLPGWPVAEEVRRCPSQAWQVGAQFGQAQAALHQVEAPDPLGERPDAWIDWLGPEESALAERLRAGASAGGILLHLDYHPMNALSDGENITGILDWRNACAGDPRADAARTVAILRLDYTGRLSPQERAVRRQFERGWRAGYERQAGPLCDMAPFYAWAGAMMQRDLASKRAADDLARIRRWTEWWKACVL